MRSSPTVHQAIKVFFFTFLIYTLSWFFVYVTGINRTLIPSEDTLPAIYLPSSIVLERDFDLNEYADLLISRYPNQDDKSALPFYLRLINGRYVSGFPVIGTLLAVPVYLIPVLLLRPEAGSFLLPILAKLAAAAIVALSVAFVYLAAMRFLDQRRATFLALIYAFGTSSFALSSQGMWQHGPVALFFSLAIYCLVKGVTFEKYVPWAGLFLSLATLTRPPVFVPVALLAFYVWWLHRRQFLLFVFLALLPLIPWFWYNHIYFGSFLQHAYTTGVGTEGLWTGKFPEGFLGLWFSPSKGLLVYSPILLLGVIGGIRVIRNRKVMGEWNLLFRYCALIVVSYSLLMGRWYHWFGGWAFSYRMMVDVLPFLVLLLVPILAKEVSKRGSRIIGVLFVLSVLIQLTGIVFYDGEWHARYDKGPNDTRWLWSVRGSELVYYGRKSICRMRSNSDVEYRKCQGFTN